MKAYLRAVQVHFPWIQDARFRVGSFVRRATRRVHDSDWLAFRQLNVPAGPVLDIGANRGQSIDSFTVVLPGRDIVAFEPNSILADYIGRRSIRGTRVATKAVALSDVEGTTRLYIPRYRKWTFDGLASTDRNEAMNWLTADRLKGFDARLLTCAEFDVAVRKLDSFDLSPAVMKLDTQGTEESVLRGGIETIRRNRPILLLETANDSIRAFLEPFGYAPYEFIDGKLVEGRYGIKNTFFLTPSHIMPA